MLGARQVGKTWLMQEFAKEAYSKSAYVNFEDNEMLKDLFAHDFDITRIVNSIQWSTGVSIDENTLIILDEIQEAHRGITALKYFAEKAPQYHVIAAGSLLGISMHQNDSFPVGKVDFMHLYPLSFFEFMDAIGDSSMTELLISKDWPMITMFRNKFEERLRQYYFVGGMPEAVNSFVKEGNPLKVRNIQKTIIESYERDFSKHAPAIEVPRIRMVWKSIPAQLAKENKKFIYGVVKEGRLLRIQTFHVRHRLDGSHEQYPYSKSGGRECIVLGFQGCIDRAIRHAAIERKPFIVHLLLVR